MIDLVKRLRNHSGHPHDRDDLAADKIEELEALLNDCLEALLKEVEVLLNDSVKEKAGTVIVRGEKRLVSEFIDE